MTLEEFAERIGYGKSYLSKLEHGLGENPSDRFVSAVSMAFRVRGDWLRNGQGEPYLDATNDESSKGALPNWSKKRLDRIMCVLDDLPEALRIGAVLAVLLKDATLQEVQSLWHEIGDVPNMPVPARLFWNDAFQDFQIQKLGPGNTPPKMSDAGAELPGK